MENNLLAYIGAIIDGEGCFEIIKRKFRSKFSLQPKIVIAGTDKKLIELLKDNFGGGFYTRKKNYPRKESYYWELTGCGNIENFLIKIIPYVLIKRKQGELLLEFVKSRKNILKKPLSDRGYTKREIKIYEEIKELKKEYPNELPPYKFTEEEKKHYLAGLVDGDGSIRISKSIIKNKLRLVPLIYVGNTDKRLMNFLLNEFGGYFTTKKRPHRKYFYEWYLSGLKEEFYKKLDGKLVIKQQQLNQILKFIEIRKEGKKTYDEEIKVFLKIKELNNSGKEEYTYDELKKYTIPNHSQRKLFVTKEELNNLYWNKKMGMRQIAKKFGVKYNSVYLRMKKYNIPIRNFVDARKTYLNKIPTFS